MSTTTTTLDALHDAILAACRAQFGDRVVQYGAYQPWDQFADQPEGTLVTPALLLEVEDFTVDTETPDPLGRLTITAALVLHCVLSVQTERLQQTLPQFAAAVAALVLPTQIGNRYRRGNDWGLGAAVEPPVLAQAQPGEFVPGLNGRDGWIVRWEQVVHLSEEF